MFNLRIALTLFMHEWALAEAVIAAAAEVAKKEKLKDVTAVTIKVGEI